MTTPLRALVLVAALVPGCGEAQPPRTELGPAPGPPGSAAPQGGEQAGPRRAPPADAVRKIVYTAEVNLIVENFSQAERDLLRLMRSVDGYLAESTTQGSTGEHRFGTWKLRVPIARFDEFMDAVVKIGELERRQLSSQDVTEEYYDLDARIKNKKVEEARLLKHLEESTGKLTEILEVEKEISRVREELERQQGRLQLLANLTALTTVTVTLHERRNYVEPAPTFHTRIGRTFQGSVEALRRFGEAVVLLAVALLPWLPVIAAAVALGWLLSRWSRRSHRRRRPVLAVDDDPPRSAGA